jgi:hypothetical protein
MRMLPAKSLLLILLVMLAIVVHGQGVLSKMDTLSAECLDNSTVEQLLGLPRVYKIESCVIVINSKNEIIKITPELSVPIGKRKKLISFVKSVRGKGFCLTLDEIHASKGNRKLKLMSKTFAL